MKLFVQNSRCPSQVLFAFNEVVDSTVLQVRWAVAYATRSGCERLVSHIANRIGKRQWEKVEKRFIISLDFGLTEPAAIDFLGQLHKSTVRVANPKVLDSPGLLPNRAYHPKVYLFDGSEGTGYVVGSANLTNSALISNAEVVIAGRGKPSNCTWNAAWTELFFDTAPLTKTLLVEYGRKWIRPQRRAVEPDPTPRPPLINPLEKPIFWESVVSGTVVPMTFDHLWIEAGSMSSGGSHNQLELPRGANRFFGFTHDNYGDAHQTIGIPILTLHKRQWPHRPLTWHGHNKMERINLPTLAQGGFEYRNTAVLFRRHSSGFEINVLPWNDDGAIAWRAASEELGAIFRFGERATRICGMF
jgi:hypothetical protein